MKLKTRYNETVVTKLDGLIDTEHAISRCFEHLASMIHNGRAKATFNSYAKTAKKNKDEFVRVFAKLGAPPALIEEKRSLCKIDPASFSLDGTLNLGMEIADIAMRYYDDLLALCDDEYDKSSLKEMRREKMHQRDTLKKERTFEHRDSPETDIAAPEVVARLYK
jgi:hypothetical protein